MDSGIALSVESVTIKGSTNTVSKGSMLQFQLSPKYNLLDVIVSVVKAVVIVSLSAVVTIVTARIVGGAALTVNQTTTQKSSTFDVTGTSQVAVIPDEARVNLGVTVSGATVAATQNQLNQNLNQILTSLNQLGIKKDDIKTLNYSIYPEYNRGDFPVDQGPTQISGYRADTTVQIKVTDFAQLNQVIDTATANGANQVNGIEFTLSEAKELEVKEQARQEAIDQAKQNAQQLAKLAGMRLGKIVNVIEQQPFNPPMYSMMDRAQGFGGGVETTPTQVEPGTSTFNYQVTVSYETL